MKEDDYILTKTQDQSIKSKALIALKKLINAPERKDMIKEVILGFYGQPDTDLTSGYNYSLILTRDGLFKEDDMYHRNKVKPSLDLIERFELDEKSLRKIFVQLQRKM
ncbi:MAG TPA: hypothetical protein PLB52_03790 [Candidatus Moranbacteria bacterium]|nr:hypothetical protein [Candidatus Moranbacteria bacterium]